MRSKEERQHVYYTIFIVLLPLKRKRMNDPRENSGRRSRRFKSCHPDQLNQIVRLNIGHPSGSPEIPGDTLGAQNISYLRVRKVVVANLK